MATRLLSFLTAIEQALHNQATAKQSAAWDTQRMVNYKDGLARMTLTPPSGTIAPSGAIFLQSFVLADGSLCLKANLGWDGSPSGSLISVYAKPGINWDAEARQIAATWLAGPAASAASAGIPAAHTFAPLSGAEVSAS